MRMCKRAANTIFVKVLSVRGTDCSHKDKVAAFCLILERHCRETRRRNGSSTRSVTFALRFDRASHLHSNGLHLGLFSLAKAPLMPQNI